MAESFLLGPIPTGSSFMLVSIVNGVPSFLNSGVTAGVASYFWDSNLQDVANTGGLPVFTASGSGNQIVLADQFTTGYLVLGGTNNIVGNSLQSGTMTINQNRFASLFPPNIFLSGAPYTIRNSTASTTGTTGIANIYTKFGGTATVPAVNLIILPVLWYFFNPQTQVVDKTQNQVDSLLNWICRVSSNPICTENQSSLIPSGVTSFTNYNDALTNFVYSYCPLSDTCGTSNCFGPCSAAWYDCDNSNSQLSCVFNPENYFFDAEWWFSPYFIGAVVTIIVIVILITVILLVFAKKAETKFSGTKS